MSRCLFRAFVPSSAHRLSKVFTCNYHPLNLGNILETPTPGGVEPSQTLSTFSTSLVSRNKIRVQSRWRTLDDQLFSKLSLNELFLNIIPTVRLPDFLSARECESLIGIIKGHEIVCVLNDPSLLRAYIS